MKHRNIILPSIMALMISMPVMSQMQGNPWHPGYQHHMGGYGQGPKAMSPEQFEQMREQRHQVMMQKRAMMRQNQARGGNAGVDCQHGGQGKMGQHGGMKHGKMHGGQGHKGQHSGMKHGKKHGEKHQAHRQQMEQRLARIETMLQQLLEQQNGTADSE